MNKHEYMNKYEYELLTNTWEGPRGAAYNACFGFCKRFGWLQEKMDGFRVTEKGHKALARYLEGNY